MGISCADCIWRYVDLVTRSHDIMSLFRTCQNSSRAGHWSGERCLFSIFLPPIRAVGSAQICAGRQAKEAGTAEPNCRPCGVHSLCRYFLRRVPGQSPGRRCRVFCVELHPQPLTAEMLRRHQRRPRTAKRVQHQATHRAKRIDQRKQRRHRLLRRMQFIARIRHVDHIRHRLSGPPHAPFCQKVGAFMLVAKKTRRRGVGFAEHDMTDHAKTCRLPGFGEEVDIVPPIKTDGKTAPFQHTVHLIHRRAEPTRVIVIADFPPVPALIVHQIRRVCQNEIHRIARHCPHQVHAVAIENGIAEIGRRVGLAGHGLCPLFREEQPSLFLCLAASTGVATARATDGEGYHPVCTERSAGRSGTPHRTASAC
ncbi:hypothetical protein Za10_1281 [Zymomonas mobilis subsp. mobilis NCIMB 11163]|nr:hypothetical protein Za10_1281 [Zymomonas mobilis subsp. mobilis NCIMB 11163]